MTDKAIIQGCYADYRRIRGRKVLQLIVEVPLEEAPKVHDAFGEPNPDGSLWVAIALLDAKASKPKEDQHRLSRQAALCCNDKRFWAFLTETYPTCRDVDPTYAAELVRVACQVESRAEFDHDHEAAANWRNLYGRFQAWLNV